MVDLIHKIPWPHGKVVNSPTNQKHIRKFRLEYDAVGPLILIPSESFSTSSNHSQMMSDSDIPHDFTITLLQIFKSPLLFLPSFLPSQPQMSSWLELEQSRHMEPKRRSRTSIEDWKEIRWTQNRKRRIWLLLINDWKENNNPPCVNEGVKI